MGNHIVVVGSLNIDLVVRTLRHPKIGETVLGYDFNTYPGGKGANQAVAAARLGASVMMIGRVGSDSFGDTLLSTVKANGVDIMHISRDRSTPTGVGFITVDDLGQNTIVVASGANGTITPEEIKMAEAAFIGAGVLLLQLECPINVVEKAIEIAQRHNVRIVLNPAPAQLLDAHLLQQVDFLVPNQSELLLLAGQESTGAAIDFLTSVGVKQLVITMGEAGALVVAGGNQVHIPAFHIQAVDTTAAGDAFAGAFAVALMEGRTILEAARWGNAAGALAVMRAGAQPSLPDRENLDRFLASAVPA
jgi:ribokinase